MNPAPPVTHARIGKSYSVLLGTRIYSAMIEQAVVLCGGTGSRMTAVSAHPKCLIEVNGKSILELQVASFTDFGVKEVLLLLGHGALEVIDKISVLENKYNVKISHIVEHVPLGTGGALLNAHSLLQDSFYLAHGDIVMNSDLSGLAKAVAHDGFDIAMMYHPSSHPDDSDLLVIRDHARVGEIVTKPHPAFLGRGLGNAGLYSFSKRALNEERITFESNTCKMDLDRELLPRLLRSKKSIAAVRNLGFLKDCGTPERLDWISKNWESVMKTPIRKPAIFFDRDGTLNKLRGFITDPEQIDVFEDAPKVVKELKNLNFWVIVITNQPVIARGEVTVEGLDEIHGRIEREILRGGGLIDDFFYCPHHPDSGFPNEVRELKISCKCRKPEAGLIEKASAIYPIDIEKSWMIGDSWRDIELARRLGLRSIQIGEKVSVDGADFSAKSLLEALEIVRTRI